MTDEQLLEVEKISQEFKKIIDLNGLNTICIVSNSNGIIEIIAGNELHNAENLQDILSDKTHDIFSLITCVITADIFECFKSGNFDSSILKIIIEKVISKLPGISDKATTIEIGNQLSDTIVSTLSTL